jgi:hypothetical protein
MGDNPDDYFDMFERLSTIYISRNLMMMYFKNTRFWRNVGTFGGAITINSPNFRRTQRPFVVISGCKFENNQAFFGGNAVYIRSTKLVPN